MAKKQNITRPKSSTPALDPAVAEAQANGRAVIKLVEAVGKATTFADAATAALHTVKEAFGWAYGSYWTLDTQEKVLKFSLESGSVNDEFRRTTMAARFQEGEGLSGRAWKTRDLFFVSDIGDMKDCCRAPVAQRAGVKSGVCFPVMINGAVIGTMDFFALETLTLSPERLETLRSVGKLVSAAMQRVKESELQTENTSNVTAVNQVLEAVSKAIDAKEAAMVALNTVKEGFGWAYGSFWNLDTASNTLGFGCETSPVSAEFTRATMNAHFREGEGLSGRAWKARDLVFVQDLGEVRDCCRREPAQRAGVKSGVCFPITVNNQVVGTMDFFSLSVLTLSSERMDALRNVGRLVSGAIERIQRNELEARQSAELRAKVDQMLEVVNAAAQGDLTRDVKVSGSDAIGQLGTGLGRFFSDLRGSISGIAQNAQSLGGSSEELSAVSTQMSKNADDTSAQAGVVSAAAEQVSKNVQTVATAAEEMGASIKEISKNAGEAARVATGAVSIAQTTNATIAKLGDSSREIGNVIKLITSIAQQTNLLALNATIEAARAGEAGKGFAVVANEVKELAKQTTKATEDISQRIAAIQGDTQSAVAAIAQISGVINQINDISNTIASAVEEQTATTNEMTRNIAEASKGSTEIAQNIAGVAQAAQSTSGGSAQVQSASAELTRMASDLQGLVSRFKYTDAAPAAAVSNAASLRVPTQRAA